jgi:hypothetical protein
VTGPAWLTEARRLVEEDPELDGQFAEPLELLARFQLRIAEVVARLTA